MKLSVALSVGLISASAADAIEVRPAAEAEIVQALRGCWMQEPTFEDRRQETQGVVNHKQVCFDANDGIETLWVGGDKYGLEGLGTGGTYEVAGGKLAMTMQGDFSDGWFFSSPSFSCDVLMLPGKAMRLENCVGSRGEGLAKMSFSRNKQ